jgi:hypothetical protein
MQRDEELRAMPLPVRRVIDAATDSALPGAAINLFASIALSSDEQGELVATYRDLSVRIGAALGTVQRSLAVLEERGYLTRESGPTRTSPSVFRVLPPSNQ